MSEENQWCDRCKEEFPLASPEQEQGRPGTCRFKLGLLYPKSKIPRRLHWKLFGGGTSRLACGNCINDVMDDEGS